MEHETLKDLREEILSLVGRYGHEKYSNADFIPGITTVPPSGKLIDGRELENMVSAALDGWLTTGRFNEEFQKKLASFIGVNELLTVNSGSSANLVAFSTLTSKKLKDSRIMPGSEVITVGAGFPTTVNPIIQQGCIPVFCDVDIPTYNIDVNCLESALSSKTRGVMLAHTLGNPFDVGAVVEFCKKHDLWLVEDCCDALGSTFNDQLVGTFGDLATLSFYPAHHLTMGEGGAVFTNSLKLKKIAESFRDWGRDCYCEPGVDNSCKKRFGWKLGDLPKGYDHKYTYSHLGYNLKITDMQAACGLAQLEKLAHFIERRKENFRLLRSLLEHLQDELILPIATVGSDPSWFGFPITVKDDVDRNDLVKYLDSQKVGTRLLFGGNLVKQPYLQEHQYRVVGSLNNTDKIMRSTFWVGVQPSLSEDAIRYVAKHIENGIALQKKS